MGTCGVAGAGTWGLAGTGTCAASVGTPIARLAMADTNRTRRVAFTSDLLFQGQRRLVELERQLQGGRAC